MNSFWDIRLQKMWWPWNRGQGSSKPTCIHPPPRNSY